MRKWVAMFLVVALLGGGWYLANGSEPVPSGGVQGAVSVDAGVTEAPQPAPATERLEEVRRAAPRAADERAAQRARADEIRRAIAASARAPRPPTESRGEKTYGPGDVTNRADFGPEIMKAMNEGLMPLIDECVDMAHEGRPELAGLLALQINAVGDPDLGAVIESVEFAEQNELVDVELQECVRESAWSLTLPPPDERGGHAVEVTIPVEPRGDEPAER